MVAIDDDLVLEMAGLGAREFSKSDIVGAGRALAGDIKIDPDQPVPDDILRIFKIANAWRLSHALPMRRVRSELYWALRRLGVNSVTAARLKRMQSIRKKLRGTEYTLYQIQDIGGCRVIVDGTAELQRVLAWYHDGKSRHGVGREFDYIQAPRKTGYRSHHLVLKHAGDQPDGDGRQRVEVQVRTQLQHVWATAVEAVGLVRREDLKGGAGDGDWLRLFAIVSSEFALIEDCCGVPGVPGDKKERRDELKFLERKLGAIDCLRRWNAAIRYTDSVTRDERGFYLIQFDEAAMQANVTATGFAWGAERLWEAERKAISESGGSVKDTVLVDLEKAEDLKAAFPNYFIDVASFNEHLRAFIEGYKPAPVFLPKRSAPSAIASEPQPRFVPFGRWRNTS